jgi:hypothetical protein
MIKITRLIIVALFLLTCPCQASAETVLVPIAKGWAKNSVNANILRHNSVTTHKDNQYVAFYDEDGFVVLAKRKHGSTKWTIKKTQYKGNVKDAHNSISIMVDGDGYLHMSWDQHGHPLRYCRSKTRGSLELTETIPMTEKKEDRVTYPEFYRLPDGDLLFLYRDGASGRGNLMMNRYSVKTKKWTQLQDSLINGEGKRNAYWQMCTDNKNNIHISWVWRETSDVATNHDMAYAKSTDGGRTWQKSDGTKYALPITASNAEYAARIPQRHELINTTSMSADAKGRPYIATYWRPQKTKIPQYHIIYHNGIKWLTTQIGNRLTPFSLSGGGTKRIPISRPHIILDSDQSNDKTYVLFRDSERGYRASVAICNNLGKPTWQIKDLVDFSVGMWEPSYDTELWKNSNLLHIYIQNVGQGDDEKIDPLPASDVSILEWTP